MINCISFLGEIVENAFIFSRNTCTSPWNLSEKLAVFPWILRFWVRLFLHETKNMVIFLYFICRYSSAQWWGETSSGVGKRFGVKRGEGLSFGRVTSNDSDSEHCLGRIVLGAKCLGQENEMTQIPSDQESFHYRWSVALKIFVEYDMRKAMRDVSSFCIAKTYDKWKHATQRPGK